MMEYVGRNTHRQLRQHVVGRPLVFAQKTPWALFGESLALPSPLVYSGMTANPKLEEIHAAREALKDARYDCIVAFGGGSVIDFAKAFRHEHHEPLPLIALPTTAGSGSQVTQFAVVYIRGEKTSLDAPSLLPDVAIVDSLFIESAPQYLKASCAMDAYCQAIESFWSTRATEESREYALEAIRLCRDCLVRAVTTTDAAANELMARAAHLAGKAINISRTTASHALSYKMTSAYGIPHGHAVALTIAQVFEANLGHIRGEDILLQAMGITRENVLSHFRQLMCSTGLEYRFRELGITHVAEIVESVNEERMRNNPRTFSQAEIYKLFQY